MPLPSTNNVPPNEEATCTFYYVKSLLGVRSMSDDRTAAYLQTLVDEHGFPPPLPTPLRKGAITLKPHPRGHWVRAAVDAWFEGYMPPSAAAHVDAKAMAAAAAAMDANAASLRLVGGRDFGGRDMERGA